MRHKVRKSFEIFLLPHKPKVQANPEHGPFLKPGPHVVAAIIVHACMFSRGC